MKNYILHEVIQYEIIHRPMIHQEFMTINTSRIPMEPFLLSKFVIKFSCRIAIGYDSFF